MSQRHPDKYAKLLQRHVKAHTHTQRKFQRLLFTYLYIFLLFHPPPCPPHVIFKQTLFPTALVFELLSFLDHPVNKFSFINRSNAYITKISLMSSPHCRSELLPLFIFLSHIDL
uniref:Uncharacterized protein n=1 Tax=Octopus bimaculoides TaxID=37653 RepID=A0A0L8IE13_OCTBM